MDSYFNVKEQGPAPVGIGGAWEEPYYRSAGMGVSGGLGSLGATVADYAGMSIAGAFGFIAGAASQNYAIQYTSPGSRWHQIIGPIYSATQVINAVSGMSGMGAEEGAPGAAPTPKVDIASVASKIISVASGALSSLFGGGDKPSGEEKQAAGEKAAAPVVAQGFQALNDLASALHQRGIPIPQSAPDDYARKLWAVVFAPTKAKKKKGKEWHWEYSVAKLIELARGAQAALEQAVPVGGAVSPAAAAASTSTAAAAETKGFVAKALPIIGAAAAGAAALFLATRD